MRQSEPHRRHITYVPSGKLPVKKLTASWLESRLIERPRWHPPVAGRYCERHPATAGRHSSPIDPSPSTGWHQR